MHMKLCKCLCDISFQTEIRVTWRAGRSQISRRTRSMSHWERALREEVRKCLQKHTKPNTDHSFILHLHLARPQLAMHNKTFYLLPPDKSHWLKISPSHSVLSIKYVLSGFFLLCTAFCFHSKIINFLSHLVLTQFWHILCIFLRKHSWYEWFSYVLIYPEKAECDSMEAHSRKSMSSEQGSTLRDLLTSTAGKLRLGSAGGAFAPVFNLSEQVWYIHDRLNENRTCW